MLIVQDISAQSIKGAERKKYADVVAIRMRSWKREFECQRLEFFCLVKSECSMAL